MIHGLKNRLQKMIPDKESIRRNKGLRPIRHLLGRANLWSVNRKTVSLAVSIGLFAAFIPVPSQMLLAAIFAVWMKANLPISVATVWVSNPLTMGPMFYFCYKLGAWLLDLQLAAGEVEWSIGWLSDNAGKIGYPFLLGCLVCSWVSAISGFVIVRVFWNFMVISKWKARQLRNRD